MNPTIIEAAYAGTVAANREAVADGAHRASLVG
jgi:hypothetical protein